MKKPILCHRVELDIKPRTVIIGGRDEDGQYVFKFERDDETDKKVTQFALTDKAAGVTAAIILAEMSTEERQMCLYLAVNLAAQDEALREARAQ